MCDNRWYRAKVEAVHEEWATVFFVDYGNSYVVKTCNLRELPKEFARQPPMAFECGSKKDFDSTLFQSFSVKFLNPLNCISLVEMTVKE
jgi:tudor domain-containing protein 1/4/6/7